MNNQDLYVRTQDNTEIDLRRLARVLIRIVQEQEQAEQANSHASEQDQEAA